MEYVIIEFQADKARSKIYAASAPKRFFEVLYCSHSAPAHTEYQWSHLPCAGVHFGLLKVHAWPALDAALDGASGKVWVAVAPSWWQITKLLIKARGRLLNVWLAPSEQRTWFLAVAAMAMGAPLMVERLDTALERFQHSPGEETTL